jgi:hypothetical protein
MALSCAGSAFALPQGAFWVEVPVVDSLLDATDLTGFRTFDLFVQLQAGDVINAADFGIAGPNTGISTNRTVFHHGFQDASQLPPNAAFLGLVPDLVFDSYVGLGNLAGAGLGVAAGITLPSNGVFGGAWFDTPPQSGAGDGSNAWFMSRITLSSVGGFGAPTGLTEFLQGQVFISGTGPNGQFGGAQPLTGVVNVPNAFQVPTPGALALFGLAGATAYRRRR